MSNIIKQELSSAVKDLDNPIKTPSGLTSFFKKGKLRCIFIYEDGSYLEIYTKFSKSYFIEHKKKLYQVVPRCIVRGKYPLIAWYYNNPSPIDFGFVSTKITAEMLQKQKNNDPMLKPSDSTIHSQIYIDAEALHSVFSSTILKGLYAENKLSAKALIIIGVVVFVMILIILQISGVVDVLGAFTTGK